MTAKPVAVRQAAADSIAQALDYYLQNGGRTPALNFVASLEDAYRHIRRYPATGSSRYAEELRIEGLRFWPLNRFSYLVFYIEREEAVDVLDVLHAQRDIPVWLRVDEPERASD